MLVSEFIDRTGYQPTAEEYAAIEHEYYHFKGDKDAYCRAWAKANPTKAGTLWAKQKENERVGKVFDRLVAHIIKYAKKKEFDRDMLYYMNYEDRSMHADFVVKQTKAKDRIDLWNAMRSLQKADAVKSGWSSRTWDYYNILLTIL